MKKATLEKKSEIIIRSIYNNQKTRLPYLGGESKTQQQFKHEANINNVIQKYAQTGILGNGNGTRQPMFGDFTQNDFVQMQNKIATATQTFQDLPSSIRKRFENRVDLLLDFIGDPKNKDEAIKLGILPSPQPESTKKGDKEPIKASDPSEAPKGPSSTHEPKTGSKQQPE